MPDCGLHQVHRGAAVEGVAASVNREPRPASVVVRGNGVEVAGSREGYELDVGATAENVGLAIGDLGGETRMVGEVLEPGVETAEAEEAVEGRR